MQPESLQGLDLPAPDAASARHSERVAAYIARQIDDAGGCISFAEYMQYALYARRLGYYVAGSEKFGPGGDYVTAPEISPLFGRVVATQCAEVLAALGGGDVLEAGAGSGALAVQVLEKLDSIAALPKHYYILEISPDLRRRQEDLIREKLPAALPRVEWLSSWPTGFRGVLLANEVADALPVERFAKVDGRILQVCVTEQQGEFAWHRRAAPGTLARTVGEIEARIGRVIQDDFESEVCLALGDWIGSLSAMLAEGFIFLFDYGVSEMEYYAPDRTDGWLRCHFRHHAHNDPLILPGIQDITTWVNFSAAAEAASSAGLDIAGFVSQAQFLLHGGLQQEFADLASLPIDEQMELSAQAKLLTLPSEMGENFKCLAMSRGNLPPPSTFQHSDRAMSL